MSRTNHALTGVVMVRVRVPAAKGPHCDHGRETVVWTGNPPPRTPVRLPRPAQHRSQARPRHRPPDSLLDPLMRHLLTILLSRAQCFRPLTAVTALAKGLVNSHGAFSPW